MNCIINLNTSSRYCSAAALKKCRLQMWALSALDTCHYNQNAGRYIHNDGPVEVDPQLCNCTPQPALRPVSVPAPRNGD